MSDQLNFEMRLHAAVKILAANTDGPMDAARIATSALNASRRAGWWTRLTSIAQPRAADLPGQSIRPLLVALLAIVAISSIGVGIYWQRGINVGPPAATSTPTPSASNAETTPPTWSGPVRSDTVAMPVLAMDGPSLCIAEGPILWEDGLDTETGFVDIIETTRSRLSTQPRWSLELASKPPLASELDPNVVLIGYGLVFDTDADGTPDHELGINNSPGRGDYHVWVTDLDRGKTVEQIGPPYGVPVEFRHPDEQEMGDAGGPGMAFWFLTHLRSPTLVDLGRDYRYYAWSSYSENGSVVAWDYAPDFGWLELPDCESLPVNGWPDANGNSPGLYSWDGSGGFMHNGYGSGDVEIRLDVVPDGTVPDATTRTEVAGHDAIYRRIDAQREEWFVEIDGTLIEIALTARPGASQLDLADAHAIIESMRYEQQDNDLGFRLVFELTNAEWDSG